MNIPSPPPPAREGAKRVGQAIAEGLLLGLYQFNEYKTEKKNNKKVDEAVIVLDKKRMKEI